MDSATPEPQPVQFQTHATCGASHEFGSDWVTYAVNTEAPGFVGGVDHSRNPQFGGRTDDGGTAYA